MPVLSWLQIGLGAAAAFALSWLLHTVDVDRIEAAQRAALEAQSKSLNDACEKDKALTKDANDGLQKQYSIINTRRDVIDGVLLPNCTAYVPAYSSKPVAAGQQHAGQHGLSTKWLKHYAAQCETYRQERVALEAFISAERQ